MCSSGVGPLEFFCLIRTDLDSSDVESDRQLPKESSVNSSTRLPRRFIANSFSVSVKCLTENNRFSFNRALFGGCGLQAQHSFPIEQVEFNSGSIFYLL